MKTLILLCGILVSGCAINACKYTELHNRPSTTDKPILKAQAKQYDDAVTECKMAIDRARNNC